MAVIDELVVANKRFSGARKAVQLPMPPSRRVAVVTCMDARILPGRVLGLEEGEAHVIRNAGGRAKDAIRSLVISQRLLGTQEVAVIHHTDCGMLTFSNDGLRQKIKDELHTDAGDFDFLPFAEVEQSVRDDVRLLQESPLIPDSIPIRGFVYDVHSGALTEVKV